MLKRLDAAYGTGRTKAEGLWWKWKIDPMTSTACWSTRSQGMAAAPPCTPTTPSRSGTGRRPARRRPTPCWTPSRARSRPGPRPAAGPFAKAYSGLTDEEFRQVDAIIRKSTVEKFGPVRSVKPSLVFELGLRRDQPQRPPPQRHRRALPAHAAHPPRQAPARGRQPAGAGTAAGLVASATPGVTVNHVDESRSFQPTEPGRSRRGTPVSVKIRERVQAARKRFHSNDNIAAFIQPGELEALLDEVRRRCRACWTAW